MNIRDFAEYALDYFSYITLTDIEEFILNGNSTPNKEIVNQWLTWLEDNRNFFTDDTLDLVQKQFENDLGGMPIWKSNEDFQNKILEGFKQYFHGSSYFYEMFKELYLKGLKEENLI